MIPTGNSDLLRQDTESVIAPSRTYQMHIAEDRIGGEVDGREALRQAIYKEINTEPGVYPIYTTYGVQKADLFGKPKPYAFTVLCGRIKEKLELDDRIQSVHSFRYEEERSKRSDLCMSFSVSSVFGEIERMEVAVHGI